MYAVLTWGFPVILILFEWGLKEVLSVDASGFMGPTLAAAGLSLLIPLTKPKIINVPVPGHQNVVATSSADLNFVAATWMMLLIFLFCWASSCYLSIKHPDRQIYGLATHLAVGSIVYAVSVLMAYVKEKI